MVRDKAPHCKATSDHPHCKRILSSALTEPQEAPQRRGTTETEAFSPSPKKVQTFQTVTNKQNARCGEVPAAPRLW